MTSQAYDTKIGHLLNEMHRLRREHTASRDAEKRAALEIGITKIKDEIREERGF